MTLESLYLIIPCEHYKHRRVAPTPLPPHYPPTSPLSSSQPFKTRTSAMSTQDIQKKASAADTQTVAPKTTRVYCNLELGAYYAEGMFNFFKRNPIAIGFELLGEADISKKGARKLVGLCLIEKNKVKAGAESPASPGHFEKPPKLKLSDERRGEKITVDIEASIYKEDVST